MRKHKNKLLVSAAASLAFSAMAAAASAETLIVASPQVPEGFDGDALKTHTQNVVVQTYENLVVYGKKMVDGQMKNDPATVKPHLAESWKISPDGKCLAISLTLDGMSSLVFRDRESDKVLGITRFPKKMVLGDYLWVNNERVVFKINDRVEWDEKLQFYGELFAINFYGSKAEVIYGYNNGEKQIGSRAKKKKSIFGWGDIIDILPNDSKNILISSTSMNSTQDKLASVYKLNVYTGLIKEKLEKLPLPLSTLFDNASGDLTAVVGKTVNEQLVNAFPNKRISISSKTDEGNLFVVATFKDDSSGVFYLFNKEINQLKYLNNFVKDLNETEFSSIDNKKQVSFNDNAIRLYPSGFKG